MADSAKRLHESALDYLPGRGGLPALRRAAADCRGCALYADATQTVFGAGPADARTVLVGEQPGDQEDRQGKPFVGPAGGLLRRALAEVGIDENQVYFTNAVKHFKFAPVVDARKRRIHKTPNLREITACRPWLAAELSRIDPELVVALGATAGKALFGGSFRVSEVRGTLLPLPDLSNWDIPAEEGAAQEAGANDHRFLATVHPSAVLRAKNRDEAYRGLLSDLRMAARFLG
ncbi:uracil-DNA glycosylase [Streptomyces gelaticus]|uniref:Type-4 uracil-DNA glycosylase n=1 Tax=Streptomyces gelaticus TaxID=285446 RepID=A0ABQ2W0E9_9ACTN|nr:UdgX family uracil-DNA binding protein [Streptomyces gelaticus]GGV86738.1 uracil-DNA glycosylase [Streptomyces gelaticus]